MPIALYEIIDHTVRPIDPSEEIGRIGGSIILCPVGLFPSLGTTKALTPTSNAMKLMMGQTNYHPPSGQIIPSQVLPTGQVLPGPVLPIGQMFPVGQVPSNGVVGASTDTFNYSADLFINGTSHYCVLVPNLPYNYMQLAARWNIQTGLDAKLVVSFDDKTKSSHLLLEAKNFLAKCLLKKQLFQVADNSQYFVLHVNMSGKSEEEMTYVGIGFCTRIQSSLFRVDVSRALNKEKQFSS
eukprot:TRINITY_DN11400_c0_g1_i1.p2 TRINITY_DN11400_c0_g1~~TRINITY_DN11400_c0_g1_i1.p2  ORF type:complete len:239 (-),score=50.46 TRINITY_DN11400_c0_g1_i1:22-738(-)